ncbi:MAG TPA: acyltransferase family protein, partial [Microlunatus sp.]|nr:acyltransferase family protein [Microlunatus sp.]
MPSRTTDAPRTVRDASLDNAKALLIVLVLLGHMIEDVPKDDLTAGLYRVIYLFHMPAFALITGYLSRRFKASVSSYLKLIGAVVVPYVIFQAIHAVFVAWLKDKPIDFSLIDTEWTMWYLVAVAIWRLATPLLRAIPFSIGVSFLIALSWGLLPDLTDLLALDRTLTLLPFFVIGLNLKPDHLEQIREFGGLRLSLLFLPLAFGISWWSMGRLSNSDFWFSRSFAQLGDDWLATGLLFRLVSYGMGLLGTVWVLSFAPRRKLPVTYIGVQSMYVYLLHSVVLLPFKEDGVIEGPDEPWLLIMSIAFACGLAALLASKPVTMLTRIFVQPPFGAIRLPGAQPEPARAKGATADRPEQPARTPAAAPARDTDRTTASGAVWDVDRTTASGAVWDVDRTTVSGTVRVSGPTWAASPGDR